MKSPTRVSWFPAVTSASPAVHPSGRISPEMLDGKLWVDSNASDIRRVNLANTTGTLLHLQGGFSNALKVNCMACLPNAPPLHCLDPDRREKTTLALEVAKTSDSVYLDLESYADRARLTDAELYLSDHEDQLVVLDEVHRAPDLFTSLRVLIDSGRPVGTLSAAGLRVDGPAAAVRGADGRANRLS